MEQRKTFYQEFEVFSKRTPSSPFQHQFSLLAPNAEMAKVMAQENFMRRDPVVDIWVVNQRHIHSMTKEGKLALQRLDNKDYRVFSKRTPSSPFQHQFSLLAENAEMAMVMAQENFMRRDPVVDIWVVNRGYIHSMTDEEKLALQRLDNKDYRTTKGYGYLKKKWRHYEQQMLDEKEILSWAGGTKK